MANEFRDLKGSIGLMKAAARVLIDAFGAVGNNSAWPNTAAALKEVEDCVAEPNICVGIMAEGALAGWIGLRPLYAKTWELHPLAVAPARQGEGLGRLLIAEAASRARAKGITGLLLGADDETGQTSLSQCDLSGANALAELGSLRNLRRHPYEFYLKCGFAVVGVVPDANGPRRPDIWMWKDISRG